MRLLPIAIAAVLVASCGTNPTPVTPTAVIEVGSIVISAPSQIIERGYHESLVAVVKNKSGITVDVPVVWRSQDEKVVTIDVNGRLTAVDTGATFIIAGALGVTSSPLPVLVRYTGASKIAVFNFTPASAISPGMTPDSVRVQLTDAQGSPVSVPTRVAFAVTAGGGTVSPAIATTNAAGIASAAWKLGPVSGVNAVTATVLTEDDKPSGTLTPNSVTFSLRTYLALSAVSGDKQTGQILAPLADQPTVKLVDSLGKPRPGVPVKFAASAGGKVAFANVSTGADGTASPGVWTLGDIPGPQSLVATVELASVTLTATGTGTPVHYTPLAVIAGGYATCGIEIDQTVSCMGEEPKVGDSSTVNKSVPTPTSGGIKFVQLAGAATAPAHFCGVADDASLYCWGTNVFPDSADTTVFNASTPKRIKTAVAFKQVTAGQAHTCAIGSDDGAYCWGDNSVGQIGDKSVKTRFGPVAVSGGFKFTSLSAGAGHTCGLATGGLALCWGFNLNGQIGDGTTSTRVSPTAVSGGVSFKSISSGGSFTCGLSTDGKLYCWGAITGLSNVTAPHLYPDAPAFTAISAGGFHACGLTADGTAYCWGQNTTGQIGDSTTVDRANPTAVTTAIRFKSLSAGYGHTCGSAIDGSVACWGFNKAGEVGDTTSLTVGRPTVPRYIVLKVTPVGSSVTRHVAPRRASPLKGSLRP